MSISACLTEVLDDHSFTKWNQVMAGFLQTPFHLFTKSYNSRHEYKTNLWHHQFMIPYRTERAVYGTDEATETGT